MKITEVRTRVVQWEGETVPLPPHFCTNPMDLVAFRQASMGNFAFHGWVLVEIFTDTGLVGLGNAALSPVVTKTLIDTYLKPLLIGADPWDTEYLWQQMYRRTMAFGRKGVAMTAISAVDIALWDLLGKDAKQPVFRLLGGRTKDKIPVYASRLYAMPIPELRAEAQKYKDEGYKAMKLRFGWGPIDGAEGMQKNVELVRNVREVVGDGVDIMADAYMGWTLDYAKRMLPLIEPFHLRWLEEPVIPDDTRGYKELKSYGRVPIAGGEHEFTIFGFRELLENNALDYIQFDTNRVGGISQARKISALAESFQVPVVPHAGQMHNYHVVMASLNSPIAEFFPKVDVEVGNELFWYIFDGEPVPVDGYIDLDDDQAGSWADGERRVAETLHGDWVERDCMLRLVQISNGSSRRVALVEEPYLHCLNTVESVYELALASVREGTSLSSWARDLAAGEKLSYDARLFRRERNGVCWRRSMSRARRSACWWRAQA